MSEHQSIEDVLDGYPITGPNWAPGCLTLRECGHVADALAGADLPLVDRPRGIAVIRLDPELADELATIQRTRPNVQNGWEGRALRRAARIIGGEQP